jgi:surfeit locus 1 family protein
VRLRPLVGLLIPLAFAALFVRLGVWQLARHEERKAANARLEQRLQQTPTVLARALADSTDPSWRIVRVAGRFRYDLEQVLAGRTNGGSPGVHLITPMAVPGTDTLVIVTRGWVYSPDAASVDLGRWREGEYVTLTGYLMPLDSAGPAAPEDRARPLRSLNRTALQARLGAPIFPVQIIMTSDSAARADSVPRRLATPVPDAGPHRSYAIQWFAFALIALVGGIVLHRRGIVGEGAAG